MAAGSIAGGCGRRPAPVPRSQKPAGASGRWLHGHMAELPTTRAFQQWAARQHSSVGRRRKSPSWVSKQRQVVHLSGVLLKGRHLGFPRSASTMAYVKVVRPDVTAGPRMKSVPQDK